LIGDLVDAIGMLHLLRRIPDGRLAIGSGPAEIRAMRFLFEDRNLGASL